MRTMMFASYMVVFGFCFICADIWSLFHAWWYLDLLIQYQLIKCGNDLQKRIITLNVQFVMCKYYLQFIQSVILFTSLFRMLKKQTEKTHTELIIIKMVCIYDISHKVHIGCNSYNSDERSLLQIYSYCGFHM